MTACDKPPLPAETAPFDRLIGSARLHRLHHSTRESEAGNFGTALPLWDQVFGTYRRGAAPVAVGVFDAGRYPGELQLRALLLWPFGCTSCLRVVHCRRVRNTGAPQRAGGPVEAAYCSASEIDT